MYARERTVRHIRANALKYLHDNESETFVQHKWNPRRDGIRILYVLLQSAGSFEFIA